MYMYFKERKRKLNTNLHGLCLNTTFFLYSVSFGGVLTCLGGA